MNTKIRAMHLQSRGIRRQSFSSILSLVGGTAACLLWLAATDVSAAAYGGGSGSGAGGGGHTETAGNNLSVPVIWADTNGPGIALPAVPGRTPGSFQASLTVPWSTQVGELFAYAQKTAGNVWQADNAEAAGVVNVDEIDWGDMLESSPLKVGTPIRIELALFKTGVAHQGFAMTMLANPSSPEEVQGVTAHAKGTSAAPVNESQVTKIAAGAKGYEATVYSPNAKLVVQKLIGTREAIGDNYLTWNGVRWVDPVAGDALGVGSPETLVFGGEINVGGKVIYGLSQGGWRATQAADYRITFSLPTTSEAKFTTTTVIRVPLEEVVAVAEEETGGATAVVVPAHNLTYIDVRVAGSGGGGGGRK